MEELICSGASHSKIEDVAVRAGTSLMIRQALKHVASQTTSIEEVFRVVAYA
jgi:type IV pilus assembly protein PilB